MIAMPTDNKPVGFMCMESDSGTLRSVFPWGARSLHSYLEQIISYPTLHLDPSAAGCVNNICI